MHGYSTERGKGIVVDAAKVDVLAYVIWRLYEQGNHDALFAASGGGSLR
jgi:hypothetical protein